MVQHVEVQPVVHERVALVVSRVERPVLAQTFRAQHQHAVVALLVVLDNGQRFEGLAQADRVGDDAALVPLELADGTHHGITLEVVELVPHGRVGERETRLYRIGLLHVRHEVTEHVIQRQEVHELGRVLAVERPDLLGDLLGHVSHHGGVVPDAVEHRLQTLSLGSPRV